MLFLELNYLNINMCILQLYQTLIDDHGHDGVIDTTKISITMLLYNLTLKRGYTQFIYTSYQVIYALS